MTARDPRHRLLLGSVGFLALHLAILAVVLGWGVHRARALERARDLPPLRAAPLALTPLNTDPGMIGDDELRRILLRLRLPAEGPPPVALVDHSLRLWGPEATFTDRSLLSGETMRGLLTHQRRYSGVYGGAQPLLVDLDDGVRVRTQQGRETSSHQDHTLAALAEVGTPRDFPVMTARRFTDLSALLEGSLRDFSLNQQEYEWSILAYLLYLPPVGGWVTSEGQEVSFADLAERLMREDLSAGVCLATHRLYTLNALLRGDGLMIESGDPPILEPPSADRVRRFLAAITAILVRTQHPAGFWNGRWPVERPASELPTGEPGDELADRLIVTGHVLEWWAMAPQDLLPPPPVSRAAARWLVRTIEAMSDEEIRENLSYLTHAGLALAHWRGARPAEVAGDGSPRSSADAATP